MALTIGGKRVTIPGGTAPATPLSPLEKLLVDGLIIVNREIVDAINAESFADAIRDLDPDLFDRLLNEVFRWQDIQEVLDNALRGIVLDGSLAQARDIIRNTPRIQQSPFADLEFTGGRLPNGILVPSGGPPDVEFAIATPVEQMFNYVSDSALNYARVRSGQLIRSIDESNRLAIRQLIAEAFTTPRSVDDTARLIRQIVGLHPRWARAVENFHDKNVQGLIADGLSEARARARADELTKRYRDKLIRRRAEMIARTEIQQALNFGRQMSWVASDRAGLVDPRTMKEWRTAPLASRYGPPCPTCSAMRGTRVPWNGVFDNGQPMPPAHPNCRCTAVLVPPARGLTGLPSQRSPESWIRELEVLEAEQIAELEAEGAEKMLKHRQGKHDQRSHGSWAKGSGNLLDHPAITNLPPALGEAPLPDDHVRMYHQTSPSNIPSISREGLRQDRGTTGYFGPKGVYLSDKPFYGTDTQLATIEIAVPKKELENAKVEAQIEGVSTIASVGDISPDRFLTINQRWHDLARDYVQDKQRMDDLANGKYDERINSEDEFFQRQSETIALRYIKENILDVSKAEILKHQRGKHDQASHGAWAKGSRADAIRDAARTGQPTGITKDDLAAIRENPAAYGFVASEFTRRQQKRMGMMPSDEAAVMNMRKALEDGFAIREGRQARYDVLEEHLSPEDQDDLVTYFETIRKEGTVFVAADPVAAAEIVTKGEFDSVFETTTSNGSVSFDARRREEFASHDLHPSLDPDLRPIYGYVAFDNPVVYSVAQYGDVRFELKPEVKTRSTMTDGDSLGAYATPIPMSGDPITRREAIAGSMGWSGLADQGGMTPMESEIASAIDNSGAYVEAQIKGGVKIDDVVRIHVEGSSSGYGYLQRAAKQKNIEIVFHGENQ